MIRKCAHKTLIFVFLRVQGKSTNVHKIEMNFALVFTIIFISVYLTANAVGPSFRDLTKYAPTAISTFLIFREFSPRNVRITDYLCSMYRRKKKFLSFDINLGFEASPEFIPCYQINPITNSFLSLDTNCIVAVFLPKSTVTLGNSKFNCMAFFRHS